MSTISRTASRLVLTVLLAASAAHAQSPLAIPPRGGAATFDVAAWNLQFFGEPTEGPDDELQAERVQAVVEQGQIDLWAFEEVVSTAGFAALLARVGDDGYAGVLGPDVSTDPKFNQRLAFVYNTSVVQPIGAPRTVVSGSNFGGRSPLELTATVTAGGQARVVRVIALHAKASSDADSYTKRLNGSAQLKAYTDGLLAQGLSVIVMGDFNDELTTSIAGGRTSPYDNFVKDPAYTFATQRLNDQNIGTFCGRSSTCTTGSTIDHILLAGPIRSDFDPVSGDRYSELLFNASTNTGVNQYINTTSDHLPVLARFAFRGVAGEAGPEAGAVALLPAAPSPFRTSTRLRFRLAATSRVEVEVVDLLGRTVARLGGAYGPGEHQVVLDGTDLAAGLYRVRLSAAGEVRTQTIARVP